MFNRITDLIEMNREDIYSNLYTKPDSKSLFDVVRFFDTNFNLKMPILTLSPVGTFRCTWQDSDYHFAASMSRPIVSEIRKYKEKFNLKLVPNWFYKKQEFLENILLEVKMTYGEIKWS